MSVPILYEDREKVRRDMASRMNGAKLEGKKEGILEGKREQSIEIAKKLLKRDRPIEEIIEDTGLTREEIKSVTIK